MTRPKTPPPERVGEAIVVRRIDHQRDILLCTADVTGMVDAYRDHARRWENPIDGLDETFMSQGLAATTLHLSCRPGGELVGFTINIRRPPTNIFITGDSGERIVTGRTFSNNVKTGDSSRLFVQTSRAGESVSQSTIDVEGLDVFLMFEDYYSRSEQTIARFFELETHKALMVFGLPEVDEDWLEDLSRSRALELCGLALKELDTLVYRFQCGCNPRKILEVVSSIYENSEELFEGEDSLEVTCPRCGRHWQISRADYDAMHQEGGDAEV